MLRIRCIRTTGGYRARCSTGAVHFDESLGGLARVPESVARELVADGKATLPDAEELCAGRFLIRRRAGMGDVLCLTPAVREVARLGGTCEVITHPNYRAIWDGWPEAVMHWQGAPRRVAQFDGWLERHPGRKTRPAALCFGDFWNLDLEDARPYLPLSEMELEWGRERVESLRGAAVQTVAVFTQAGWPTRVYRGMLRVAKSLANEDIAVLGFGDEPLPCCRRPPSGLGVRQLASLLAACDLVVTGDTGPLHLAAAVRVPSISVFCCTSAAGSVGPRYDTVALEPEGLSCWPCWAAHCRVGDLEIPGSCVQAVPPEQVAQAALGRLRSPAAEDSTCTVDHNEGQFRASLLRDSGRQGD